MKWPFGNNKRTDETSASDVEEKFDVKQGTFQVMADTNVVYPGTQTYQIQEIPATLKKPWVTFRPVERIIVEKYNTGVNGGTTFVTYSPIMRTTIGPSITANPSHNVDYERNSFFTPMTKTQAMVICYRLNNQMRQFYQKFQAKTK